MFGSIVFYNALLLFSVLFAYLSAILNSKTVSNIFYIVSMVILIVPASLRYGIGTDYFSYGRIYNNVSIGGELETEPFFWLINFIVFIFKGSLNWVLAISSILFISFTYKSFKKEVLAIGVFFSFLMLYSDSYNAVRQVIAISISLYAASILLSDQKNRIFIFLALIVFGSMFHFSCLFGILILFFFKIKIPKIMSVAVIVFFWFASPIIASKLLMIPLVEASRYGVYADIEEFSGSQQLGTGLGFMLQILPALLVIFFKKKLFSDNLSRNFFGNSALFLVIIKIMAIHLVIIYRFVDSFDFLYILLMVELCKNYRKSWFHLGVSALVVFLSVLFFEYFLLNGVNEIMPYRSIIFQN